jgi:predicted Rossmann fold flavoprotein
MRASGFPMKNTLSIGKKNRTYELIVIGGGPAGLFAARTAADQGMKVCLLEKKERPGKKLLLSGSGQCNLTHAGDIREFPNHYGPGKRFVRPCLLHFTNLQLMRFFEEQGVGTHDRGDGKVFPLSGQSRDVLGALEGACRKSGVRICCKTEPVEIDGRNGFSVRSGDQVYTSPYLLIATGGLSYPSTGSTGDGYFFAESLGHRIISPYPVLTPVDIRSYALDSLSGLSFSSRIILRKKGKKTGDFQGDLLFTHKGFSGPVILNNSREMEDGDELRVSFLPEETRQSFEELLLNETGKQGKKTVKRFLLSIGIPERFASFLLHSCAVSKDTVLSQLRKEARRSLTDLLLSYPAEIQSKGGFNKAMATGGGIPRDEVNPKTMESNVVESLHFAGEVLDIDGDTGGYNLQFAFSSGKMAADHIVRSWKGKEETRPTGT